MALVVPIVADTSGLVRALGKGQSGLRRFGKIAAGVAGAAAFGGLVATVKVGIDEFMEAQKVMAQTNAVLKSTGGVAKVTSKDITTLSSSIMKMTGIDDEAVQAGQNLLLTFTKIRNETGKGNDIFDQATLAMTNLSVAMGKDLSSSAILVGKALNNPVKGVSALSRAGVQFTDDQKNLIETLVDSGNVMDAQKMILRELETQFGGSAEAAGKTLPGQLNILKQTFSNLAGELVSGFLPSVARVATRLVDFLLQFGKQPTLDAKIRLIVGSIGNIAWSGIRSIYTWWDTQGRVELPARVILIPSGRQQFDTFFTGLEKDARALGVRMGRGAVEAFIGLFSSQGRSKLKETASSFAATFTSAAEVFFRITGTTLLQQLTAGFLEGAGAAMKRVGQALVDGIVAGFNEATGNLSDGLKRVVDRVVKRSGPVFRRQFAIIISDPIKEAIASARSSLAGLGSSLGEMLSKITGATSPEAKEAAAIRKRQKAERKAREEKALRDALATAETDDERQRAQVELDDWILEAEAQRLEDVVADRQAADALSIDNLITEFNRGLIGFEEFSSRLDGIIGTDRGTELGIAFADGFSNAVSALTTTVQSIVQGVAGVQAPAGTEVAAAQSGVQQENSEKAYQAALRKYNADRAARLKRAEDARRAPGSRAGTRIDPGERAEIHAIMAEWDGKNPKPQRSAFGLARGGILKQPTFVAGEAGREAVIPLESSSAMKILRDAIGGGGGSTVVYNLVVNAGLGTDPDDLGRVIVESIKRFEKRNGQAFSAPLLSVTQNVAGQTATGSAKTDFNRLTTLRKG
jgi:hypothetical protein